MGAITTPVADSRRAGWTRPLTAIRNQLIRLRELLPRLDAIQEHRVAPLHHFHLSQRLSRLPQVAILACACTLVSFLFFLFVACLATGCDVDVGKTFELPFPVTVHAAQEPCCHHFHMLRTLGCRWSASPFHRSLSSTRIPAGKEYCPVSFGGMISGRPEQKKGTGRRNDTQLGRERADA